MSVDQDGNLWVADTGHNNVMAFDDTGAYVTGSQFSDTYGSTSRSPSVRSSWSATARACPRYRCGWPETA